MRRGAHSCIRLTGCWLHLPLVFQSRIRLYKLRYNDEYPRTGPLGADYVTLQVTLFPSWHNVSSWARLDVSWYDTNRELFAAAWASRSSALDDCPRGHVDQDLPHAACTAQRARVHVTSQHFEQHVCNPPCAGAITSVVCFYDSHWPPEEDQSIFYVYADDSWQTPKVQATFRDLFAYKSSMAQKNVGKTRSMWHGHAVEDRSMHFALPMPFWHNASVRVDSTQLVRCEVDVVLGDVYDRTATGHFRMTSFFSPTEGGRGGRVFESELGSGHVVMATVGLMQEPHYLQW